MADHTSSPKLDVNREGWWTREHTLVVVLVAATALLLYLCWLLIQPFVAPITWALALAVVAHPLHRWFASRISKPGVVAGIAVFVIAVMIVGPTIFVGHQIVREAAEGAKTIKTSVETGSWREKVARSPRLAGMLQAAEQQKEVVQQVQGMAGELGKRVSEAVAGSIVLIVKLLLMLFVLFFLFRDRHKALAALRSLVPLSEREADEVIKRVADTMHATIYGTLVIALIQGVLGGLMFWWLGLPAPILWGAVMALLALIPVLGAPVIWVPAAIFLAMNGQIGKAAILTAWGVVVVGLIDNLLFPILVGDRMRMHTVPVFFAIVGGLHVFGAAGLVLGPVILALTIASLDIWRRRTAHGKPAEAAVKT